MGSPPCLFSVLYLSFCTCASIYFLQLYLCKFVQFTACVYTCVSI
nr:MAG TPA: hypothetical protein [Caudoviricetes sp.]